MKTIQIAVVCLSVVQKINAKRISFEGGWLIYCQLNILRVPHPIAVKRTDKLEIIITTYYHKAADAVYDRFIPRHLHRRYSE